MVYSVHTICYRHHMGLWSSSELHKACLLALSFVYRQHKAGYVTLMSRLV